MGFHLALGTIVLVILVALVSVRLSPPSFTATAGVWSWSVLLIFLVGLAGWIIYIDLNIAGKKARDTRLNLCRHCGYSLIGNTSGVCPECATEIPVADRVRIQSAPIR